MSRTETIERWIASVLLACAPAVAQSSAVDEQETAAAPYEPEVAAASGEGEQAIAGFTVPDGFAVELWAAEPLLANPVAIALDERGRCFVAETFRLHGGVLDVRDHMDWLDDDLAARTVEDRLALMARHADGSLARFEGEHDRVRLVEDSDGDGRADRASVFADGFEDAAAGIGAGVLAHEGSVYFTCIPALWRLADRDGDGVAEEREALSTGYGVHVSLIGHDLHGLRIGPDGRLYFTVGDRGLSVRTKEGALLDVPDCGAVLRCDLDGSSLEVYATGLRNPQELAFDERGNLFTGDNNSDGGDRARLVWVLEGGDSGWRYPYQWIGAPEPRGPWNGERLWEPAHDGQPAYVVPPVANLTDGPSGLTHMPGLAWGEAWRDTFFLCDFRGTASASGVHALRFAPDGAGFRLAESQKLLWGCLATDADFGPDGALYVSDWVDGWTKTGKGRIYRIAPAAGIADESAREVGRLLGGALEPLEAYQLRPYLGHADQRVRLAAQLLMAERAKGKDESAGLHRGHLADAAVLGESLVERLHGIWGLGQLARSDSKAPAMLFRLLEDPEPEVRAQVVRVLGESRYGFAGVKAMLADPHPRVRLFAAEALGHYGTLHAVEPLIALVRDTDDRDPWIRHACVRALERLRQKPALLAFAADPSSAVRRAVCLVLRRWQDPEIARFLEDADSSIVAEAARAIHDVPIEGARDALAAALERWDGTQDAYLVRRALAANLRDGAEGAARIARFVARRRASDALLVEALELLARWDAPSPRDPVVGAWRPFAGERSLADVAPLARELAAPAAASGSERVLAAWIDLVARTGARELSGDVRALLDEPRTGARARIAALDALIALEPGRAAELVRIACADDDAALRSAAFARLPSLPAEEALALAAVALEERSLDVRRAAVRALAEIADPRADERILGALAELETGTWPRELELDLLECAERREEGAVREKLARFQATRASSSPLGAWLACASGGNAERGRRLFVESAELACLRCHRVGDEGGTASGGEVGPDLTAVGARLTREELLDAIVRPSATLSQGYERWVLVLDDDSIVAGAIRSDDGTTVRVLTPAEEELVLDAERIAERRRDLSAMPEGLAEKISRRELRDLVEYLASLR